MPTNIKNQKEESRSFLLRSLGLPKTTRAIILSFVKDEEIKWFLREAWESIGIAFLTWVDAMTIAWSDAFIAEEHDTTIPMVELLSHWVVPIVSKDQYGEKVFQDFNPMKFEGNAFLFAEKNKYQMFEKIVSYLENVKYPGDRRTLLGNVVATKV